MNKEGESDGQHWGEAAQNWRAEQRSCKSLNTFPINIPAVFKSYHPFPHHIPNKLSAVCRSCHLFPSISSWEHPKGHSEILCSTKQGLCLPVKDYWLIPSRHTINEVSFVRTHWQSLCFLKAHLLFTLPTCFWLKQFLEFIFSQVSSVLSHNRYPSR